MSMDKKLVLLLLIVCLVLVLWFALDHVLFPDLPVPAGVPPITK